MEIKYSELDQPIDNNSENYWEHQSNIVKKRKCHLMIF